MWSILGQTPLSFDDITGSFVVPLLSGPVPIEIFSADEPIKYMVDKAKARHPSYRVLEGECLTQALGFAVPTHAYSAPWVWLVDTMVNIFYEVAICSHMPLARIGFLMHNFYMTSSSLNSHVRLRPLVFSQPCRLVGVKPDSRKVHILGTRYTCQNHHQ